MPTVPADRSPAGALARYAAVGAVATLTHFLVLTLWVEAAGGAAWIGSGLGAVVGAQVAFVGNRWLTFAHQGPRAAAWWRFMGTAAFGAVVGMAIVAVVTAAGGHYLLAQALATGLAMLLTFAINRRWTFGVPP